MGNYDPSWPVQYQEEAQHLRAVLPEDVLLSIEHFGSSAIPGLAAKPIIDILVIWEAQPAWGRLREPIDSVGYLFWSENPDPDHMFFVKGMPRLVTDALIMSM